ncbi:hypothetical protein HY214_04030 [Candidatus Roizmanbacteria bacterium]|nr:hypothetical protein [Candidatus Roizmanbacteria bacterium]
MNTHDSTYSSVEKILRKLYLSQSTDPDPSTVVKMNPEIKFLLSRQDLLNHIAATERSLKNEVKKFQRNDKDSQERLLNKYVTFQTNLSILRSLLEELNKTSREKEDPGRRQTGMMTTATYLKLALINEFSTLLREFDAFLANSGYLN